MNPVRYRESTQPIETWLIRWIASEFGLDVSEIDQTRGFLAYGMNSVQAMMLVGDLEVEFGLRLPPTLVWDYPNASALVQHLANRIGAVDRSSSPSPPPSDRADQFDDRPINSTTLADDPAELLAKIDDLNESELDALLAQYLQSKK